VWCGVVWCRGAVRGGSCGASGGGEVGGVFGGGVGVGGGGMSGRKAAHLVWSVPCSGRAARGPPCERRCVVAYRRWKVRALCLLPPLYPPLPCPPPALLRTGPVFGNHPQNGVGKCAAWLGPAPAFCSLPLPCPFPAVLCARGCALPPPLLPACAVPPLCPFPTPPPCPIPQARTPYPNLFLRPLLLLHVPVATRGACSWSSWGGVGPPSVFSCDRPSPPAPFLSLRADVA
jgi:hypothetical protein